MPPRKKKEAAAPVTNAIAVPEFRPVRQSNGLAGALGLDGGAFPWNQGTGWGVQVSQPTTVFKNLRWFLVSNLRQMLSQAYVEIGLIQTICDVPVDDGLRGGIEIKTKQLDEDEINELHGSLDRDDDINTAGQAGKWNRLFGGAGVIVLTDQDPSEELQLDWITEETPLEFRAVDLWELLWDKQNSEGYDPSTQTDDFDHYNYYGVKLHKSRVMRLKGLMAPSFIRPRLRGWGFSVVEALVRSINQYLKATDLGFEVLDEFKLDIYRIKNMVNTLLSPDGEETVRRRIQLANLQKNYQNAIVLDSEDEYENKQLSFTGLAETMRGIKEQVSSDMRMPMIKLFGQQAGGGLGNTGEDEIEVYNAMVEAQVRNKLKYVILRMVEIKCQKHFGFVPDDLTITFKPLRILGAKEEEDVKTQKFTRLSTALQAGAISHEEFVDACNRGNLFDIAITGEGSLLASGVQPGLAPGSEGGGYEDDTVGGDDDENEDTDNPGANRADSKKSKAMQTGGVVKGGPGMKGAKPKSRVSNTIWLSGEVETNVDPYTRKERIQRALVFNSLEFDLHAYEADGGNGWIDPRRKGFFENPGNVDEALWSKAKDASKKAFGEIRWQFVTWFYQKHGGKFN